MIDTVIALVASIAVFVGVAFLKVIMKERWVHKHKDYDDDYK